MECYFNEDGDLCLIAVYIQWPLFVFSLCDDIHMMNDSNFIFMTYVADIYIYIEKSCGYLPGKK